MENTGLFGQEPEVKRKQSVAKPGKGKRRFRIGSSTELSGICARALPNGTRCVNLRKPQACHPVPCGRDVWGFVTPCEPCAVEALSLATTLFREDFYSWLAAEWPAVVEEAINKEIQNERRDSREQKRNPAA